MEKTENAMGTKKVMPLLISMSVPPMISMLIQALYNIVDSMYVARVSEDALTAVSIAFPLQNLRQPMDLYAAAYTGCCLCSWACF